LYAPTAASVSAVISTTIASPPVTAFVTAVFTAASAADGGKAAVASMQGIEGDTCCGMTLFFACDHICYTCERHQKNITIKDFLFLSLRLFGGTISAPAMK
jgi:hypothetical protein